MHKTVQTHSTKLREAIGLITGLLIGALAGVTTMLLLAPRSGKITRAQLQERATDTFDDLVTLSHFDNREITIPI